MKKRGEEMLGAGKERGYLLSGEYVCDRSNSHLHKDVPLDLLRKALKKIDREGRTFIKAHVDMGRVIGLKTCVRTSLNDEVVFAQRIGREGLSRFVKNREAEHCSFLTVILKKDSYEDFFWLITAFVADKSEPEPWDRNATFESFYYWEKHALVFDAEDIVPGTETEKCPW